MPPKKAKKAAIVSVPLETKKVAPLEEKIEPQDNQEKIIRRIFVAPEKRITDNVIRKTELARLLSLRAESYTHKQISFTNIVGLSSAEQVAFKELIDKKFPLNLIRDLGTDKDGNTISEIWDVNEMTIPSLDIIKEFTESVVNH